jgi:hypothetical protein
LPPASTVIEAPRAEAARLPPSSAFKPGSPGDVQRAPSRGRATGVPGEVGGTGAASQAGGARGRRGSGGGGDEEISELQARIDRLLLVFAPDHPDVVPLQRRIDQLYADRGPLAPEELAEARQQLGDCWGRASARLGVARKALNLSLVLDRDGSVREATLDAAEFRETVSALQLLDVIRGCGKLPLPPERYLLWQRLTVRVGAG